MYKKCLAVLGVLLALSGGSVLQAQSASSPVSDSASNSVQLDFNIALGGDATTRSVVAAYGRPVQLRYQSRRPGSKSWRLELLASPDTSTGVADAVKVSIKLAEPVGAVWRVVQESEMILAPGVAASLKSENDRSQMRDIEIIAKPRFIPLAQGRMAGGASCPDLLQPADNMAPAIAVHCCGGGCQNGDSWQCCGALACCNCGSCCTNSPESGL